MRLLSVALRGVTRFPHPVVVDFEAAGSGLVAIVGANGAGKTTIIESVPAALYKVFPSRSKLSLYDSCHGRDAYIEAVFGAEDGPNADDEVRIRLQIDAEARKTEGYVFVNGSSLTSGRAVEFDAEVQRLFGSKALLLASVFAAQGKEGNFLEKVKGDRKELFVELLGLGYLELLAEQASDHRASAEVEVGTYRRTIAGMEDEVATLPQARERERRAKAAADQAFENLKRAREAEDVAVAALERARTADQRLSGLRATVGRASMALDEARERLQAAEKLGPAAKQANARRRATIEAVDPDKAEERAKARHAATIKKLDERVEYLSRRAGEKASCEAAVAEVERLTAELEALEGAAAEYRRLDGERGHQKLRLSAAEGRLALVKQEIAGLVAGWEKDAGLLAQVPCTTSEAWRTEHGPLLVPLPAICPLLEAARLSDKALAGHRSGATKPAVIEAQQEVDEANERLQAADDAADAAMLRCDAGRLDEIKGTKPMTGLLAVARETASRLQVSLDAEHQLTGLAADRKKAGEELQVEVDAAEAERRRIAREMTATEVQLAKDLEAAMQAVASEQLKVVAAEKELATAKEALRKEQDEERSVQSAETSLSQSRQARLDAETAQRVADRTKASEELDVTRMEAKAKDIEDKRRELEREVEHLSDWVLLEKALGKDGIQALEIDAAGPEVARLTNELLEACYGSRFQIAFETLREKKSAKGEYTEAFDVRVFDEGQERQVEALSGGERVVVGEAVSMALAIFNTRRSGIRWRTIFRDETAGALDPRNAIAYVDMLRRALALGGFEQVVFVAHQPEVWERADARLFVEDGRVRLHAPDSMEEAIAVTQR